MDKSYNILLFLILIAFVVLIIAIVDSKVVYAQCGCIRIEMVFSDVPPPHLPILQVRASATDSQGQSRNLLFVQEGSIWVYTIRDMQAPIQLNISPIPRYIMPIDILTVTESLRWESGQTTPLASTSIPTDLTGIYERLDDIYTLLYQISYITTHQYIAIITIITILTIAFVIWLVEKFFRMVWYHFIQIWL